MTPGSTIRWRTGFAGVALLAAALLATGCGRPPDETWLRVLHFEKGSADSTVVSSVSSVVLKTTTTTTNSTTSTTTILGATDYVVAVFANQSTVVGSSDKVADGVTVDQVRITYAVAGYSPPAATYAVTLYVPANTSTTSTSTTGTTGTKLEIALVSTDLKRWLTDSVPKSVLTGGLHASARLVFHARTDAGSELETEAGIGIVFLNTSE